MIKIFYNDRPLYFVPEPPDMLSQDACVYDISRMTLSEIIRDIEKTNLSNIDSVYYIISTDVKKCFEEFSKHFTLIEAAGGVVTNTNNQYLLIFRYGKWDLPKGKMESGESPEETAIREVEEECGIQELNIINELPSTFHNYKMNNKPVLKKTYWYEMAYQGNRLPAPQTEESITEARWVNKEDIEKYLENTYNTIREIFKSIPTH